jgi:hypothetical protein
LAAAVLALLASTATAGPARAESLLWTLLASPLTATTGVETTFTLTATNEDLLEPIDSSREIGCVVVDVPANFKVAAATVTGSNAGGSWAATLNGNQVRVQAGSGGDRLELLGWVTFTVRATAQAAGSLAWGSRAYRDQSCGGSGALLNLPPIVVVTGPPVTPTPQPTATPTPLPSILPTLRPTPILTPLPTLVPTLPPSLLPTPRPTQRPSNPTPFPTPGTSGGSPTLPGASPTEPPGSSGGSLPPATASGTATASASPADGGPTPATGSGPGPGDAGAASDGEPALRIDPDLLFGVGVFEWVVPAAAVGVPGLLVIAWVAAQAGAALIWIPAVRRFREERRRRHRLRTAATG